MISACSENDYPRRVSNPRRLSHRLIRDVALLFQFKMSRRTLDDRSFQRWVTRDKLDPALASADWVSGSASARLRSLRSRWSCQIRQTAQDTPTSTLCGKASWCAPDVCCCQVPLTGE